MSGRPGIGVLAAISLCLLLAAATVVADAVTGPPTTSDAGPDGSADMQTEYARLMALARATRRAVAEQKGRVDVSGLPALGSEDAALAIIEFSSYQCGYCRRHFVETMPHLKAQYIDTGRLRYVFRDLSLDPQHRHAAGAAEAAYCADEQGRYEAFRRRLFQSGTDLAPAPLRQHAQSVGLDLASLQACIDSGRHRAKAVIDPAVRRQLQIRGTPTFIIGFLDRRTGEVIALRRISGARSIGLFERHLAKLEPVTLRRGSYAGPVAD